MSDTPRIIRKKTGNFLEDFRPGQVFRHHGGKTITDGLFAIFSDFSMATNPLSKNDRYAKAYGYRGMICPPALTMLVAFSQTVEDISENARANRLPPRRSMRNSTRQRSVGSTIPIRECASIAQASAST